MQLRPHHRRPRLQRGPPAGRGHASGSRPQWPMAPSTSTTTEILRRRRRERRRHRGCRPVAPRPSSPPPGGQPRGQCRQGRRRSHRGLPARRRRTPPTWTPTWPSTLAPSPPAGCAWRPTTWPSGPGPSRSRWWTAPTPSGRSWVELFNRLVTTGTRLDLLDTQCGFKAFRTPAARLLFHLVRIDRFAFDVEVLARARRLGLQDRRDPRPLEARPRKHDPPGPRLALHAHRRLPIAPRPRSPTPDHGGRGPRHRPDRHRFGCAGRRRWERFARGPEWPMWRYRPSAGCRCRSWRTGGRCSSCSHWPTPSSRERCVQPCARRSRLFPCSAGV